jgi:hypothetical protein
VSASQRGSHLRKRRHFLRRPNVLGSYVLERPQYSSTICSLSAKGLCNALSNGQTELRLTLVVALKR